MEKQDAAVSFRVRLDVSQRRAGGDAFALVVGVVWFIYLCHVGVGVCVAPVFLSGP